MTTIAYRDGVIACESRTSFGKNLKLDTSKSKIIKAHGVLAGAAGRTSDCQKFLKWVADDRPERKIKYYEMQGIIILSKKKIHLYNEHVLTEMEHGFFAIGSGEEFAYGAMYAGATAVEAVKAAIEFNPGSGGKVRWLKL